MKNFPNKFSSARDLLMWLGMREFVTGEVLQEYDIENSFDEFKSEISEGRNYWMSSEDGKAYFYIYDYEYIFIIKSSDISSAHTKVLLISVNQLKSECIRLCSLAHFMIHEEYREINGSSTSVNKLAESISLINLIKLPLLDESYGNLQFRFKWNSRTSINVGLLSDASDVDSRINLCFSIDQREDGGVRVKIIPDENFDLMSSIDDLVSNKLNFSNHDKDTLQHLLSCRKLPWKLGVDIDRLDVGVVYLDSSGKIHVTSAIKGHGWMGQEKEVQIELNLIEKFLKDNRNNLYNIELEERYSDREVVFVCGAFWYENGYGKNGRFVDRIVPAEDIISRKYDILSKYSSLLKYLWVCDRPSRSLRPALRLVINGEDIRREYEDENAEDNNKAKTELTGLEAIADKIPALARLLNLR